jgi:hypothetical protein
VLQFDTWANSHRVEDLLDYTEGMVTHMANAVFNDWPTVWVAPHLRAGAPRHLALPSARTAAIRSAVVSLHEWDEQLSDLAEFARPGMPPVGYAQLGNPPPPLEWPTDDEESSEGEGPNFPVPDDTIPDEWR